MKTDSWDYMLMGGGMLFMIIFPPLGIVWLLIGGIKMLTSNVQISPLPQYENVDKLIEEAEDYQKYYDTETLERFK